MAFETLSLEHSSTVDRVVEELRRALFAGEVEAGTPLREVALAEAMGVARSTIREALAVLVAEGLAERVPHRGVQVADLDAAAVADVCRARVVLETAGVRRWQAASEPARQAVRDSVEEFAASPGPTTTSDLTAAHLAVHRSLVGLLDSPRLLAHAEALYSEVRLALARIDRLRQNHAEQVRAHQALLELLERGDLDEAAAEIAEHLQQGAESMLALLRVPPATPAGIIGP